MKETVMYAARNVTQAGHGALHETLHGIAQQIHLWIERVHTRHQLSELDDHMLSDIGLTRPQVEAEVHKPFWRGLDLH